MSPSATGNSVESMNDPAGAASALGIERVEWLSEGGESLTVRVTGRWRRRRPAWSTQPTLVIDAPGHKHRFPAMPEPPSLNGVPPGMWRISFAVPAELAPSLRGSASVQFGGAVLALPAAVEDGAERVLRDPAPDQRLPAPASDDGMPRERKLDGMRRERERLGFEHELIVRRARAASRVPSEPAAPTVVEALDELQTLLPVGAAPSTPGQRALICALRAELDQRTRAQAALRARLVDAETRMAARLLLARRTTATLLALRDELDGLRGEIGREREARGAAERRATEFEAELELLRPGSGEVKPAAAAVTVAPSGTASVLRLSDGESALRLSETESALRLSETESALRLSEALVRLRDGIAPLDERLDGGASPTTKPAAPAEPQAVQTPWLRPAIAALTKTDPDRAGRLIVDLLAAQRVVDPAPVAYDLVLGGALGCVRVTVDDTGSQVVVEEQPRSSAETDFRVFGDYAAIARLLAAGRLRRRLGLGLARVRGKRKRLTSIDAVVDAQLSLWKLYEAGVRMHPRSALALFAQMIEPAPDERARFALAYHSPPAKIAYLVAGGGATARVTETAPEGPIATTISGPAGSLERVLAGVGPVQTLVAGDHGPLMYLRDAIKRAQSA